MRRFKGMLFFKTKKRFIAFETYICLNFSGPLMLLSILKMQIFNFATAKVEK